MAFVDFVGALHNGTKRDYVQRVVEFDKADCAEHAKQYGYDYWDGGRQFGYGGYKYDGRWRPIAEAMVEHYGLTSDDRILDVGCGKGYLLYEMTQVLPGVQVTGLDISQYAIDNCKEELKGKIDLGEAKNLPYKDNSFDFVMSLGTLHNVPISSLFTAVKEIERVGRGKKKYIMLESFRNERERANLLYWQLTCESFHSVDDWEWIYQQCGFQGDWGFIFFE